MEFKKSYFNSSVEYNRNKGLSYVRDILPIKDYLHKKSKEHLNLHLLNKWRFFKNCKIVLDAGCGRGEFLKTNPYKIKVIGIDLIKEEINRLKNEGFNVLYADLKRKLPFKDNSFDGIMNSHVLEHLTSEDAFKMISELKRVLKPNGTLVIIVPNYSFSQFYRDPTHKRPWPKEALFRILRDSGFKSIRIINGVCLNQLISATFLIFPKLRFLCEKLFGILWPSEIIAIAKK